MTMVDRCKTCLHARAQYSTLSPLTSTLDPRYKQGWCANCDRQRVFERVDAEGPAEGARLRDQGMNRAINAEAAAGDWPQRFDAALQQLAASGQMFTSENATDLAGVPVSSGAVGAKINAAAKRGEIVWTGRTTTSMRAKSHGAMLKIWQGSWAARSVTA